MLIESLYLYEKQVQTRKALLTAARDAFINTPALPARQNEFTSDVSKELGLNVGDTDGDLAITFADLLNTLTQVNNEDNELNNPTTGLIPMIEGNPPAVPPGTGWGLVEVIERLEREFQELKPMERIEYLREAFVELEKRIRNAPSAESAIMMYELGTLTLAEKSAAPQQDLLDWTADHDLMVSDTVADSFRDLTSQAQLSALLGGEVLTGETRMLAYIAEYPEIDFGGGVVQEYPVRIRWEVKTSSGAKAMIFGVKAGCHDAAQCNAAKAGAPGGPIAVPLYDGSYTFFHIADAHLTPATDDGPAEIEIPAVLAGAPPMPAMSVSRVTSSLDPHGNTQYQNEVSFSYADAGGNARTKTFLIEDGYLGMLMQLSGEATEARTDAHDFHA